MTAATDRTSAVIGFHRELARTRHLLCALASTIHDDEDALDDTMPGTPDDAAPDSDFTMTTHQPTRAHAQEK